MRVKVKRLIRIDEESSVPLIGTPAFGVIDRGTNLIQVRPTSVCPLSCIFCSTDAGPRSRTRIEEYLVDLDYLMRYVEMLCEIKGAGVEAHIDTMGDPFTYPKIVELVRRLREIPEIEVISAQTHGPLLTPRLIDDLERAGMDRINLSIDSLSEGKARYLSGTKWLRLDRILDAARRIAESSIDLLVAPVWIPGINDEDIPQIIDFALSIGAGKRWPPLGIQKYEVYRRGRKAKAREMSWREFYAKLRNWEEEFGVKLIIDPKDFGIRRAPTLPPPHKLGEVVEVKIKLPGPRRGEVIGATRERSVILTDLVFLPAQATVRARIVRSHHNLFVGIPVV